MRVSFCKIIATLGQIRSRNRAHKGVVTTW